MINGKAWISFEDNGRSQSGKTRRWLVTANDGGAELGEVKWYAPWRRYSFYPDVYTLYESDCLRAIADFCESQTREHKAREPGARP